MGKILTFLTASLFSVMIMQNSVIMMTITLLLISIIMSMIIGSITMNSWMAMITVLVYAGGMMLLFTYVTVLAPSTPPMKIKKKQVFFTLLIIPFIPLLLFAPYYPSSPSFSISSIYDSHNINLMIFMAYYLLMLLGTSLLLTMSWRGPLSINL